MSGLLWVQVWGGEGVSVVCCGYRCGEERVSSLLWVQVWGGEGV